MATRSAIDILNSTESSDAPPRLRSAISILQSVSEPRTPPSPPVSPAPSRAELGGGRKPLFPRPGEDPAEAIERESYLSGLAKTTPEAEIGEGMEAFGRGEYARGLARTGTGLMRGVAPLALGYGAASALAAPLTTAAEFGGGAALEYGTRKTAEALGATPEQAELAGLATGVIPIVSSVRRGIGALRGEAPLSVVPKADVPAAGPAVPPSPLIDVPTGATGPRTVGPELAAVKPDIVGAAPMDFSQARQRLADVETTLAEAGRRRLTQAQQEALAAEKVKLEQYLSREQMSLPATDPNELSPAIPPSPTPEWTVPPGGRLPPKPYRSVLESEKAAAESVGQSAPSAQTTLWGEHFPAVEKIKEVAEALEGGSTAARKFIEGLKPEERDAFLNAARDIADAEARAASTGLMEAAEPPQTLARPWLEMLGADPGQTGQGTMPFGDIASLDPWQYSGTPFGGIETGELGPLPPGRIAVGPDLSTRITRAAELAGRLKEFEPHQQSVMWGSELTDFPPERPVYRGEPPAEVPPEYFADELSGQPAVPPSPVTTATHRMDLETAQRTYPALKAQADAIMKREARLQKLQQRIYDERQKAGSANYSQQKVDQLEEAYRKAAAEGPSPEESSAILETVRQIEQQIGTGQPPPPVPPPPQPPRRGGQGSGQTGPPTPAVPPAPVARASGLPESGGWIQRRTELEDALYPVKSLEKMAREPLPIETSAYHRTRMYPAVFAKAQSYLDDVLRKGLKPIRQTLKDDIRGIVGREPTDLVQSFERYMTNAHELDVADVHPGRVLSGGRTREQVIQEQRAIQESLGKDGMKRVLAAQKAYSQFGHQMLDELVDAGAFSAATAARLKQIYPRYVPLQRVLDATEQVVTGPPPNVSRGSRSMSVGTQDIVQKLTEQGSELEIQRPLQTMSKYAFDAFALAERNRASRALYDLADREEFAGSVIRLRQGAEPPPNMKRMSVLIDGQRHDYAVPQQVGEAMQGMTRTQADVVTEIAGKSAQALRMGATTLSLPFLPANMARDYMNASMRSPVGFTPLDSIKGLYHYLKKDEMFHEWMRSGSPMAGFFEQFKTPQREARHLVESQGMRGMKKILNPFELFSEIGQAGENMTRIGLYARGRSAGMSTMEAGFIGRDTTVDFAKSGKIIRVWNMLTPFINARIQGTGNMLRTFRSNPGEAALSWWALIGGPLTGLYLYNTRNHPEAYRDMQPYTEENYFPLITGDEKDEDGSYPGYKFPMEEFAQFGGRSLLAALQYLDEQDPELLNNLADKLGIGSRDLKPEQVKPAPSAGKVIGETAAGLLPVDITPGGDVGLMPALRGTASGLLPPLARGILEAGSGTSFFTGRPIAQLDRMKDLPEPEKYVRGETPDWLVSVGKWTNTSPARLKHILESQFATVGRTATRGETPLGQVQKRFTGIPGGAVESEGFERTREVRGQAALELMEVKAPAEQAFKELKALPDDQKAAGFQQALSQLQGESQGILIDLITKDAGGLTREEQSLKAQQVGVRAMRLLEKQEGIPDDQAEENVQRWVRGGLLTKDTFMMMQYIEAARGQDREPRLRRPSGMR